MISLTLNRVAWAVALSNLAGMAPLCAVVLKIAMAVHYGVHVPAVWCAELVLLLASITASVLMHMSETKHGLNGVLVGGRPFVQHSQEFLWFDRAAALMLAVLVVTGVWRGWYRLDVQLLAASAIGILALFASENLTRTPVQFMLAHSLWHITAYAVLFALFSVDVVAKQ
jgi:hypothetical protein